MAKWQIKTQPKEDVLSAYDGVNSLVASLLWQRGVEPDRAAEFLSPKYEALHDPYLFRDMRKAVDRIWKAIDGKEKILIYADYDADAVTANAVLQQTFRYLGVKVSSYIPDRFAEGYGLNTAAFKTFAEQGVKVVITVDCGINSTEEAELCRELGVDLIITDHHELLGKIPNAYAVVNPKVKGESYPDPQITGVGVAFKLACAILGERKKVESFLAEESREHVEHWEKWLLDLVAIGTVADCHSLLGENRIFVHYGLLVLRKTKWPGLSAMLRNVDVGTSSFSTHTLGFVVAPRINAAGRLEHADIALQTLLAVDNGSSLNYAEKLEAINNRRQDTTKRLISEAREQALARGGDKVLVLSSHEWHKGVVGIAAGRIAEEFGKPCIVLAQENNSLTGSARTYGEFSVVDALVFASDNLTKYGGHKQAAGLSLSVDKLDSFRVAVNEYAEKYSQELLAEPVINIDAVLSIKDVNLDLVDMISELEPFGEGNEKPLFLFSKAILAGAKKVGTSGEHAQLLFTSDNSSLAAIAFQKGYLCDTFRVGQEVAVVGELIADAWNGMRKVKVRVVDIKLQNEWN